MSNINLTKAIRLLAFFFLLFAGMYYLEGFLVPVVFAALLAMLFTPLSEKLERKNIARGWAVLICVLILVAVFAGIVSLVAWQINDLLSNADQLQEQFAQMVAKIKVLISTKLGVSHEQQQQMLEHQRSASAGKASQTITRLVAGLGGILTSCVLVMVYMYLFMYFRTRLRNFVLKLTPTDSKHQAEKIMDTTSGVIQKYLSGLAMMIVCLWIMYGIGFSIIGVKHALFFAVLCGLLEIVPFVGNITGTTLTVLFTLAQGGDMNDVIGIVCVYGTVQFLQSYILEPLVVGRAVSINPLFTILIIVFGEFLWGIPGMILALPLLAITKIIFDNISALKPYGYLVGEDEKNHTGDYAVVKWLKGLFTGKKYAD
ncbi:AI-2E family transporter [Polluticoccus soli]|uniref:AI-2E family transporter n=1 Tax=Polluticoccus soli TaxID=3034150 RepID=UPI0023E1B0DD|nr:AI-2E family transporter [Flavipsychrobacter sp. JY13-12]